MYLAYTEAGDRLRLAAALGLKGAAAAAKQQQKATAAGASQQQQDRPPTQRGPPGGGGATNRDRDRDRERDTRAGRDPRMSAASGSGFGSAIGRRADDALMALEGGRRGGGGGYERDGGMGAGLGVDSRGERSQIGARDERMMRDDRGMDERMGTGRQARRGERDAAERDSRQAAGRPGGSRGALGFYDNEYSDDYYGLFSFILHFALMPSNVDLIYWIFMKYCRIF